jgi:6-phosphogluconate dehydrogenase
MCAPPQISLYVLQLKPIFQKIAAQTKDGEPCCDWVGAVSARVQCERA